MEFAVLILIAGLASGCGYLGGRWHASHKLAYLQAKLESDTENYLAMLEERNQDFVRQKEQITKARNQNSGVLIERDRLAAQVEIEKEKAAVLLEQTSELKEQLQKFRSSYNELEDSRLHYRDAKVSLDAQVKKLEQENMEIKRRNEHIEEKFNTALIDKTRLQTDIAAKDREVTDMRKRLTQQEDLYEPTELTLSQLRNNQKEMAEQLAHAQGKLAAYESLQGS